MIKITVQRIVDLHDDARRVSDFLAAEYERVRNGEQLPPSELPELLEVCKAADRTHDIANELMTTEVSVRG